MHIVSNGKTYEVHEYEYDKDGRRWEKTIAGQFVDIEQAQNWINSTRAVISQELDEMLLSTEFNR